MRRPRNETSWWQIKSRHRTEERSIQETKMLGLTSSPHGMAAKEATNHRVLTRSWMEEMLDDSSADVHSKA